MSKIIELTTDIIAAHASSTSMTKEELITEIKEVFSVLTALEQIEDTGLQVPNDDVANEEEPAVSKRKAFGKDKIYCMVCGKGFTTLKRHLKTAHDMSDKEYREKFDIPAGTALAAKSYSENRRQMALEKDLAGNLEKARAAKKQK